MVSCCDITLIFGENIPPIIMSLLPIAKLHISPKFTELIFSNGTLLGSGFLNAGNFKSGSFN